MKRAVLWLLLLWIPVAPVLAGEIQRPSDIVNQKTGDTVWSEGEKTGRETLEQMTADPGGRIFGPAVGAQPFQTYDPNQNNRQSFTASVLPDEGYAEVSRIRICLAGVQSNGISFVLQSGGSSSTHTAALIGLNGFAVKNDQSPSFDPPHASYFFWTYNKNSGTVNTDAATAAGVSAHFDVPAAQALEDTMCVAPSVCGVTENTIWLNYATILDKLGQGIIAAVKAGDPDAIVSLYHSETETSNCISYSVLKPTDNPDDPNAVKCWTGPVGTLPTCESIKHLEERGENFEKGVSQGILGPGEAWSLSELERSHYFYDDEENGGVGIRTPYALVYEKAQGEQMDGGAGKSKTVTCSVFNHPWGSRRTGWLNNVAGRICKQSDWDCIQKAAADSCAAYEADSHCYLLEERVDGVPNVQFGEQTHLGTTAGGGIVGGSARCWYQFNVVDPTGDYHAFFQKYAPDWVKNDPRLQPDYTDPNDPNYVPMQPEYNAAKQNWLFCGDFHEIYRTYVCKYAQEMCVGPAGNLVPCWDQSGTLSAVSASNQLVDSINAGMAYDSATDSMRGHFEKSGGGWANVESSGEIQPGFLNTQLSQCNEDEKVCVVAWCAQDQIYSDARPRGSISPTDPWGNPQQAPTGPSTPGQPCPMVNKEVRNCELNDQGRAVCPITPEEQSQGMWVQEQCGCISFLGDALAYLGMLRTLPHDVTCGGNYTDPVTQQLTDIQNSIRNCASDSEDTPVTFICGDARPVDENIEAVPCSPDLVARSEPFLPFTVALWADDNYRCMMTYIDENENWRHDVEKDFGYMEPKSKWFDYCYDSLLQCAEKYVREHPNLNMDWPPTGLCSPSLAGTEQYTGSRPAGCGYDKWTIQSGPTRVDHVDLYPTSEFPFGWVDVQFTLKREFDCLKTGLDCTADQWLDCFTCSWRSTGWDCNGDCIQDNNYSYCNRLQGWDCNVFSSSSCRKPEFTSCQHRSDGYDFNGDCTADCSQQTACSNTCNANRSFTDCGTTSCSQCTGCGTASTYACNCYYTQNHSTFYYSGSVYTTTGGCDANSTYAGGYTDYSDCEHPVHYTVCRQKGSSGSGSIDYVSSCTKHCDTCYKCYVKVSGTHVSGGWYCSTSGSVSGCSYTNGPLDSCSYISGYDCGLNGGADANQSPDGCVDNDYHYCAHILQSGWDCDHPGGSDCRAGVLPGSNNQPIRGTCSQRSNLADLECGSSAGDKRQFRCSRKDFPGRCCQETKTVAPQVKIQNFEFANAGNYKCRLIDPGINPKVGEYEIDKEYCPKKIMPYDDPSTGQINDEARFITEGCRERYNAVEVQAGLGDSIIMSSGMSPVSGNFFAGPDLSGLVWKYIAYEDLFPDIGNATCQWRDYVKHCYCPDVTTANIPEERLKDFVFTEDKQNPEMEIQE